MNYIYLYFIILLYLGLKQIFIHFEKFEMKIIYILYIQIYEL